MRSRDIIISNKRKGIDVMSESSKVLQSVGLELLKIVGSLVVGLLMRKKVGRLLIRGKKWLFNDFVTIDLLSIRTYEPLETNEFNMNIYNTIKAKIPETRLDHIFHNGMRISIPVFGTMKVILSENVNLDEEDMIESIKVSLDPENPIRIGVRETNLLYEFSNNAEILFHAVERLFIEEPNILSNYMIAEISRIGGFIEEKTFEIDDKELAAHIHATPSKITVVAEPPTYMARTLKKYLLV